MKMIYCYLAETSSLPIVICRNTLNFHCSWTFLILFRLVHSHVTNSLRVSFLAAVSCSGPIIPWTPTEQFFRLMTFLSASCCCLITCTFVRYAVANFPTREISVTTIWCTVVRSPMLVRTVPIGRGKKEPSVITWSLNTSNSLTLPLKIHVAKNRVGSAASYCKLCLRKFSWIFNILHAYMDMLQYIFLLVFGRC